MASVRRNLLANLGGSAWSSVMVLAFVPVYLRLMGVESYGLVGLSTSLQAVLNMLDLGLTQTMYREMARLSMSLEQRELRARTAWTLELLYWALGAVVLLVSLLLSPLLAFHWLKPQHMSSLELLQSLWAMALVIGLRWPVSFYIGGLNGLQRQPLANLILVVSTTLQGVGGVLALLWIAPSVRVFFGWQALVSLIQVAMLRGALWNGFEGKELRRFSRPVLAELWGFASGLAGASMLGLVLREFDKLMMSRMLDLTDFGYYVFAATVASVLYKLIVPVYAAYFQRLTQLCGDPDEAPLARVFHQGAAVMAVAILPLATVLIFFPVEILSLWTDNLELVRHSSLLVALLVAGTACTGLMTMPYELEVADGQTGLIFRQNLAILVLAVPAVYAGALLAQGRGAATAWMVTNLVYLIVVSVLLHRRRLRGEWARFWGREIALPLVISVGVVGLARLLWPAVGRPLETLLLGGLFLLTAGAVVLANRRLR